MSGTGTTISNLPPASSALLSDLVPVVQLGPTNVTMSVTLQQIHDLIFPSGAMTIAGPLTVTTGPIQLANNVALQAKNTTGTYQNLIYLGTDNNPHIGTNTLHLDAGNGVFYSGGSHAIAFSWDGAFINGLVDGTTTPGQMASVSWTSANYLNKGGDTATGPITVNGIFRDAGGRIISQHSGGNPSVAVWDIGGGVASAMWEQSNGVLAWGDCDGNGVPTNTRLTLDRSSNLTANGNLNAGGDLYTNGSLYPDGNIYAGGNINVNGYIMNNSGIFYVANNTNYYMGRSNTDGHWRFVDNNTVNSDLDPSGNLTIRGVVTAGGIQSFSATGPFISSNSGTFTPTGWTWNCSFSAAGGYVGTGFFSTSDRRAKADIEDISEQEAIAWIMRGRPRKFKWIDGGKPDTGFIAQEEIAADRDGGSIIGVPDDKAEYADGDDLSPRGMRLSKDYNHEIAFLTKALQSALARIAALEARVP